MRISSFLAIGFILLFTIGCNEQREHDGHAEATAPATADHERGEDEHAEEGGASSTTVTLDNGKRWIANTGTTNGIAKMVALVDKQIASPGDAKALKAALEEEFALIFERCTMTGEAHDQLHNYLIPIHQRLSGFDASDPLQLAEMKDYLGTYGNYFE